MLLSIVIPVRNEGNNIQNALIQLGKEVTFRHEIFVIYDSPDDDTLPVIKKKFNFPHIHLLKNSYGKGVLNAIKTGFENSKEGAVVVMMADFADDPGTIPLMFAKINEGFDLVCATRYSKGGRHLNGPMLKSLLSRGCGWTLHYLIGIPTFDTTNAFKMYSTKLLNSVTIESRAGFELSMEITLKAFFAGYKITEIATIWRDRTSGKSNFLLWAWLPSYLHWYFWALKKRFLHAS